MHGNRFRLKQQLEKEKQELEKRKEEEEIRTRRETMVTQSSTTMEVPQRQNVQQSPVEVPQTILEVRVRALHAGIRLFICYNQIYLNRTCICDTSLLCVYSYNVISMQNTCC